MSEPRDAQQRLIPLPQTSPGLVPLPTEPPPGSTTLRPLGGSGGGTGAREGSQDAQRLVELGLARDRVAADLESALTSTDQSLSGRADPRFSRVDEPSEPTAEAIFGDPSEIGYVPPPLADLGQMLPSRAKDPVPLPEEESTGSTQGLVCPQPSGGVYAFTPMAPSAGGAQTLHYLVDGKAGPQWCPCAFLSDAQYGCRLTSGRTDERQALCRARQG